MMFFCVELKFVLLFFLILVIVGDVNIMLINLVVMLLKVMKRYVVSVMIWKEVDCVDWVMR